jgi:hypothetical protein
MVRCYPFAKLAQEVGMYLQSILAGAIGAALTFGGQQLISILQRRTTERYTLLQERNTVRDNFRKIIHRMGQQTSDYVEISQRGSLDGEYWERFRVMLNDAWLEMSDAMVPLPQLGDVSLLEAARKIHTLFALRVNCFYNEHPDAITLYLGMLRDSHSEIKAEDFRWDMETTARNRRLYWALTRIIDDRSFELARLDSQMSLRELRAIDLPEPIRGDDASIYEEEGCWPIGSILILKKFRL